MTKNVRRRRKTRMSEDENPPAAPTSTPEPSSEPATIAKPQPQRFRKAINLLKGHPLGIVALIGAAAALVEIELAVGILTGIGATALLATKNGPQAREEVLAKGKWAIERARAFASRPRSAEAAPASAAAVPAASAATPAAPTAAAEPAAADTSSTPTA
jgi:hypothetical protein